MKGGSPVSDDEVEPVEAVSESKSSDSSRESQSSSDASPAQEAAPSRENDSGPAPESLSGYKDDDGLSLSKEYSNGDGPGASSSKESDGEGSFRSKWRDMAGLSEGRASAGTSDSEEASAGSVGSSRDDGAEEASDSEKSGETRESDAAGKDPEKTDASSDSKETGDSEKPEEAGKSDDAKASKDPTDVRDSKGTKDVKDSVTTKDAQETKDAKAARDPQSAKETKDAKEAREAKEKEDKYKDQMISLLTEQVQLLTKMVQMMGGEVPQSSVNASGTIKDGKWGDLMGSWGQGKEGNCSSVATIKAAMDKYGSNVFDKTEGSPEEGYKLTMKDGTKVSLSPEELQTAKRMDNFEGSGQARDYADLAYAAMAKRALNEGHEGSTTYARACHSLNNGEDPLYSAHALGLDNNVVPLTANGLENADSAVGWSDTHAVYVDQGYVDHYGTATEYNGSDTNRHWLYGGFRFK
jgi:hypothetical protein